MKKLFILVTILALTPMFTACNTIGGIGKDVAAIGNGLAGASSKVKDDLTRER